MLHRKVNSRKVVPTTPYVPTYDSDVVQELVEVRDPLTNDVISSDIVSRPIVTTKREIDLVSPETADMYDIPLLQEHGIDVIMTQPYFRPTLDDINNDLLNSQKFGE